MNAVPPYRLLLLCALTLPLAARGGELPHGAVRRMAVTEDGEGILFGVAFSPDGKTLAAGGSTRKIHLFDVKTGELLRSFGSHPDNVWAVAWSPDGELLCSGGRADLTLRAWDPRRGHELKPFEGHKGGITRIRFFRDGKRLIMAGGSWDPTIRVWDVERRQQLMALSGHGDLIDALDLAPHGRLAVSGSRDGSLRLWDLTRGREVWSYRLHEEGRGYDGVAFSPDGRMFAAGSSDGRFEVRETLARRRCLPASERNGTVRAIAFSPDGKLVAFTSDVRPIALWDTRIGQEVRSLRGHRAPVHGLAFSPDGKLLASSGADSTVVLWDVPAAADLSKRLSDEDRASSVDRLGSDNPVAARHAVVALSNDTGPARAALARRLKPAEPGNAGDHERWAAQLASASYAERERAMLQLERAGEQAEPTLRRAWAAAAAPEQRRRLERLLDRLDQQVPAGEMLWSLRAVAVLELRGDGESRRLLTKLAAGAPSRLTTEVSEALMRLGK